MVLLSMLPWTLAPLMGMRSGLKTTSCVVGERMVTNSLAVSIGEYRLAVEAVSTVQS